MNGLEYINYLKGRISHLFDFKPTNTLPIDVDLFAEMNAADEGYLLVKSLKTYSVRHNEYIYAKIFEEQPIENDINPIIDYIKTQMQELKTDTEHMSSMFIFALVCENGMDAQLAEKLMKFKFHKDYFFTLKGWSDLAIVLVDLQNQDRKCNKIGEKALSLFTLSSNC